jgi:superfamily II DNA helicase RecQ
MTRKDAQEFSDMINSVGLKSMWLTSQLSEQQRSLFLQTRQEGPEQVLVSTFTDGIDNSFTEDIIAVDATYSIYSLVQATGRIRPKRQSFNRATVYIFHSRHYNTIDDQDVVDIISRAIGANLITEMKREEFTEYYKKMLHISGYKQWIQQKACYRKALFEHFSITSQACHHCSNCRNLNEIAKSARKSSTMINQEIDQRKAVCDAIHTMLTHCYVCKSNQCNDIQCLPGKNRCYCCHVAINRANIHKSADCPANTSGKKIYTGGQACPSRFISFSNDIPDRGKTEDHLNNQCPHKKRIKGFLLYGVENSVDRGNTARNLLVSTLSNPIHWFDIMAVNINLINKRKR